MQGPRVCSFPVISIPGTAGAQVAEAVGGLLRVGCPRMELEAGGQAALTGEGLGLSHPRLKTKGRRPSPVRRDLRREGNPSQSEPAGETPPTPTSAPWPHPAARAPAPAPCAVGPGSHLLAAAVAPAWLGEPPSRTEAEGRAASGETRWKSGSLAAGEETSSQDRAVGDNPPGCHTHVLGGQMAWALKPNSYQALRQGTTQTVLAAPGRSGVQLFQQE